MCTKLHDVTALKIRLFFLIPRSGNEGGKVVSTYTAKTCMQLNSSNQVLLFKKCVFYFLWTYQIIKKVREIGGIGEIS